MLSTYYFSPLTFDIFVKYVANGFKFCQTIWQPFSTKVKNNHCLLQLFCFLWHPFTFYFSLYFAYCEKEREELLKSISQLLHPCWDEMIISDLTFAEQSFKIVCKKRGHDCNYD